MVDGRKYCILYPKGVVVEIVVKKKEICFITYANRPMVKAHYLSG